MASAGELKYQRANTKAFIDANSVSLVLTPRTKHIDGSGWRFADEAPRAAQTVRLIEQTSGGSSPGPQPGLIQTSDGRERLVDYTLLMEYDGIVELWDYWVDAEGTWEVAQIFPFNGYEVRAAVVRRA